MLVPALFWVETDQCIAPLKGGAHADSAAQSGPMRSQSSNTLLASTLRHAAARPAVFVVSVKVSKTRFQWYVRPENCCPFHVIGVCNGEARAVRGRQM
jgi:hypothetical protein